MKDNHEKIREQYEEKLTNLENERKTLEEKLENNQSLEKVLRTECNDVRNRNKELICENDNLKEKFSNIESLLKAKVAELTEIKGQLDFLWNQTHHLTDLSPLPNIVPTRDLSVIKVLSNNLKTLANSPIPTTHLVSVDSGGDRGACACGSHSTIQKSSSTTGLISVDVTANTMTNSTCEFNISSCNRLANLHKEIAQADMNSNQSTVSALPCEVSNDKYVENPSPKYMTQSLTASLITENTETKNLERIRTLLIAELTSLQLLHSMFDLTVSSLTKSECSKESMCVPLQNKSNLDEFTEKEDDRHSSSTPSGYETGSHRGSQVDIIHCNDDDAITSEYLQDSDEEKINNETFQLSPVISNQITDSVPSTISSPDLDLHSVNIDKISLLHKEIDNQRKTIDEELVKMLYDMIGNRMLDCDNRIRKRDIYCHLVRVLTDSNASQFDIDQLEQILNLVLVDHSITGCLLTLSHREKTKDVEKLLSRLSTFESVPKSIFDHSDEQKYFDYDNNTTEVDSLIPYVSPSSITAALTTMQMVTDNEIIERVEGDVDKPVNDCEFPTQQRKGLSRFLCVSVSSIRRPKKRKTSKIVQAKEN